MGNGSRNRIAQPAQPQSHKGCTRVAQPPRQKMKLPGGVPRAGARGKEILDFSTGLHTMSMTSSFRAALAAQTPISGRPGSGRLLADVVLHTRTIATAAASKTSSRSAFAPPFASILSSLALASSGLGINPAHRAGKPAQAKRSNIRYIAVRASPHYLMSA